VSADADHGGESGLRGCPRRVRPRGRGEVLHLGLEALFGDRWREVSDKARARRQSKMYSASSGIYWAFAMEYAKRGAVVCVAQIVSEIKSMYRRRGGAVGMFKLARTDYPRPPGSFFFFALLFYNTHEARLISLRLPNPIFVKNSTRASSNRPSAISLAPCPRPADTRLASSVIPGRQ